MLFGEALINAGLVSENQLGEILNRQKQTNNRIGDIALEMGMVSQHHLAPVLAQYFNLPHINLKQVYKEIKADVIDLIPQEIVERHVILPLAVDESILTVAVYDPLNLLVIDMLKIKTGRKVKCVIATEAEIREAIEYCYHDMPRLQQNIEQFSDLETEKDDFTDNSVDAKMIATEQPVVQYVKSLIVQAFNSRASDILIHPKEDLAELKFRVDGTLYNMDPPPKHMLRAITTRIKIISGLDIAERRLPQDGRFKVKIGSSEIDLRVSTFPTIYGESVVMRLLETTQPLLGLEQLGLNSSDLVLFREIVKRAYGLILVTGPTGSGKTTTLYTTLNEIKSKEKNILTLEDPVEYRLPFIQQSQVNSLIGFDFARGLRSILRQDPDVIMVGEIRDQETAQIAIHAALTGHLVFSTLHTNDAAGAAVRLIDMGVEPFLITSSLLGVMAQRLIRRICPDCKEEVKTNEDDQAHKLVSFDVSSYKRGRGCKKCFHSGYFGREGIYELLIMNEEIRRLILQRRSGEEIRAAGVRHGMKTLRQIGMEKMKAGTTTPQEIFRITQENEDEL